MKFITVVAIAALFYMSTCESRELMRNRRAVAKEEGEKSHDSKMDEAHAQPAKRYYPGPGLGPGAWGGEPMCWYLDELMRHNEVRILPDGRRMRCRFGWLELI